MGLGRRIVTLAFVVAVSFIGIPLPAHAASGEEAPPLTFNGRPLSELLHGRATGAPFPLSALLQQDDGQISGVVVDEDGRPLVEHAVQLTRVFSIRGNRAEQISGTGMTNVEGGFSFSGLQPSGYEIEALVADAVIASATVTLVPGAMQVRGVTITRPPTPAVWDGTVLSSFEALQPALSVGQEIGVTDDAGRTEGKVVSISANQLVIERRRFFRRTEELAFPEDVVRSIDIVDSDWEGLFIGTAAGFGMAYLTLLGNSIFGGCDICVVVALSGFIGAGPAVGSLIDRSITQPIYEQQSQTPRITIAPSLGRDRKAIVAHVGF